MIMHTIESLRFSVEPLRRKFELIRMLVSLSCSNNYKFYKLRTISSALKTFSCIKNKLNFFIQYIFMEYNKDMKFYINLSEKNIHVLYWGLCEYFVLYVQLKESSAKAS